MSAGGYDGGSHMPPYSRYEPRRASGHMPPTYDRPPNVPPRRRSPSPGSSRRPYDNYIPHRPEVPFRDGPSNTYRTSAYRPQDHAGSYYSRSPSPDSYNSGPRSSEADAWDRGPSWRAPPIEPLNGWPERKSAPISPTTSARGRDPRDDIPPRAFEPSDSWKQTHDRPPRHDYSPDHRYFNERRGRNSIDGSPDRAMRNDRAPSFSSGGDRYRPASFKREAHPGGRSDSYRPQYDSGRTPLRRDPISPSGSHIRRDSGPFSHPRGSSRHDSPYTNRSMSRKGSPSPHSVNSPINTPNRPVPDSDNWTYPTVDKQDLSTRPLSRSSIASTHASDRSVPPIPPIEQPVVVMEQNPIPKPVEVPKIPEPEVPNVSDSSKAMDVDVPMPDAPKQANGSVSEKSTINVASETNTPPSLISSKEKNTAPSSPVSAVSSALEKGLSIITPPQQTSSDKWEVTHDGNKDVHNNEAPVSVPSIEGAVLSKVVSPPRSLPPPSSSSPAHSDSASIPRPVVSSPPVISEIPTKECPVLEIKQPQPTYLPPTTTSKDVDMDINNIPPTTHSPVGDSPPGSPEPAESSPSTQASPYPTEEELQAMAEIKTKEDALRYMVMSRLLADRQTREVRINPVLMANLAIATPLEVHPTATPDSLLERMFSRQEQEMKDRMASFIKTRPMLARYLEKRHGFVNDKIARLREEYLSLQEKWTLHCNALNEQQRTLASEHELQHGGRTTRRSTAITDAVRSDFEMEQIIASLGVDDATDPNHLSMRNLAKIPDMISVTNGQIDFLFDDTSHLVDNPKEYYAPHTGIQDWKDDEKAIFLDKFAAHPKQFGIIADFLPNKTAAQCVDYYYLHKNKFIDFRRVVSQLAPNKRRRRGVGKKKGNGLLVDIALHDMEVNRGGAANVGSVSAPITRAPRGRKTAASIEAKKALARRSGVQFEDTPTNTPTPEPETAPAAPTRGRRRKTAAVPSNMAITTTASASVTPSRAPTPAMPPPSATPSVPPPSAPPSAPPSKPPSTVGKPPPVSVSAPPMAPIKPPPPPPPMREIEMPAHEPEARPAKRVKRTRKIKSAAIVSDDPPSPTAETDRALLSTMAERTESGGRGKNSKTALSASQWPEDDKNLFISLLSQHGDDFKRIAASMPNKTTIQVSNYYYYHLVALGLDTIAQRAPKRTPTPDRERESWNDLPYQSGTMTPNTMPNVHSVGGSRGASPPMASLGYEAQRHGHMTAQYPGQGMGGPYPGHGHGRHLSSEAVHPQSAPPLSRIQQQHYSGRTGHPIPPQPPMAHLGATDSRRSSLYSNGNSSPRSPYPFPTPPDQREAYPQKYAETSSRAYGSATQSQPYYAAVYPATTSPSPQVSYIPTVSVAPVHSPTGLSSPAKLPMHTLHPYPSQGPPGDSPHHTTYYAAAPPPSGSRNSRAQWSTYNNTQYAYRDGPLPPPPPPTSGGRVSGGRRDTTYVGYGDGPSTLAPPRSGSYSGPLPPLAPPANINQLPHSKDQERYKAGLEPVSRFSF